MPNWRYRNPLSFPSWMHEALRHGGFYIPHSRMTKEMCDGVMNSFRYFRWCIRQHPNPGTDTYRELYHLETNFRVTMKKRYDRNIGAWGIQIDRRARLNNLLDAALRSP